MRLPASNVLLHCELPLTVLLHSQRLLAQATAAAMVQCRAGSLLWQWPGVSAAERTVHAVWLGEAAVAAMTTAGKIYSLPKQTGAPVTQFMKRLTVCLPFGFESEVCVAVTCKRSSACFDPVDVWLAMTVL